MKYTREQLEGMGFNVNQIEAIFESAKEEQEVNNVVTQMDKKENNNSKTVTELLFFSTFTTYFSWLLIKINVLYNSI